MAEILIASSNNSVVFKVWNNEYGRFECKKVLRTTNEERMRRFRRESEFLEELKDNPLCVRHLRQNYYNRSGDSICEIYTEFCENGNLKNYILSKRTQNQNFGLLMFKYIELFVNFFEDLQNRNISHRDIKPENIFIDSNENMKIGDFGCSTWTLNVTDFSIQGSPYFLSPELRQGYQNYIQRIGGSRLKICPYKSDVFSLGLVFLCMATVEFLDDNFFGIDQLSQAINSRLNRVADPIIKEVIKKMLVLESGSRPDFKELKTIIAGLLRYRCQTCGSGVDTSNLLNCTHCNIFFHNTCNNSRTCSFCNGVFSIYCRGCNRIFDKSSYCAHSLCENCVDPRTNCMDCCWLSLKSLNGLHEYYCPFDNIKCQFFNGLFFCERCSNSYCSACKQIHDAGLSCFRVNNLLNFRCKCSKTIEIYYLDSLFYPCNCCGFRCVVCLRSINFEHTLCSKYISKLHGLL